MLTALPLLLATGALAIVFPEGGVKQSHPPAKSYISTSMEPPHHKPPAYDDDLDVHRPRRNKQRLHPHDEPIFSPYYGSDSRDPYRHDTSFDAPQRRPTSHSRRPPLLYGPNPLSYSQYEGPETNYDPESSYEDPEYDPPPPVPRRPRKRVRMPRPYYRPHVAPKKIVRPVRIPPKRAYVFVKRERPRRYHVRPSASSSPAKRPYRASSNKHTRQCGPAENRKSQNRCKKSSPIEIIAGWSFLTFKMEDGKKPHVFENAIFTGLCKWGERLFISVPRFKPGVPATLTWLPEKPRKKHLRPFPDWSWQRGHLNNCSGFVSVFRTRIDGCGRLWAIDSGTIESEQICPPRLLTFDLRSHELVRSFTFPNQVLRHNSLLTFIVLDPGQSRHCDDLTVYVSDAIGAGLIVYDAQRNKAWRIEHETFAFSPEHSTFTIAGETTSTDDGIIGMAIANVGSERMLFYQALSSLNTYAIPISTLQKPSLTLPVKTVLEKPSPGVALASDDKGFVYFSPLTQTSIVAIDATTGHQRIIVTDEERLQFVSDVSVDTKGDLWMVSNRFQSFEQHTFDPHDINLRIMRIPASNLLPNNGSSYQLFN